MQLKTFLSGTAAGALLVAGVWAVMAAMTALLYLAMSIPLARLATVLEKLLDDVSFAAGDSAEKMIAIDVDYVRTHVGDLARDSNLSKFIL